MLRSYRARCGLVWHIRTKENTAAFIVSLRETGNQTTRWQDQESRNLDTAVRLQLCLYANRPSSVFTPFFSCWFLVKETQLTPWR